MNIGEYIQEKISLWSVEYSDSMISLELSRVGHSASESMSGEINLDLFWYNVIPEIILMPKSVSEGGYSVSFDKEAMVKYYSLIAGNLGKPDRFASNTITDITAKWG